MDKQFEEWYDANSKTYWTREAALAAWNAAMEQREAEIKELKQANNDLANAAIRPDGYVLVPVEPTEKMVEAIMKRTNYYSSKAGVALYKAMIQASQEEE